MDMIERMEFNQLWENLSNGAEAKEQRHEFKRGENIYRQGEHPKGIYFVEKGLIGLIVLGSSSGNEHLLRFFRQGQIFGHRAFFSDENYHASTVALEPTIVKLIPKEVVSEVLGKQPQLYRDVILVLAKELRQSELQRVMILENQILARTAQALVYLKDLHPEHNWTRQEIANFTASTASTIIKALAQLESKGYIEQQGRSIVILNREGLIALQDHENP